MIEFIAEKKYARLHDPRRGFELAEVESEIRWDPLTGNTARICHFALQAPPPADLSEIVEGSRSTCPFCPGRVDTLTPRFPEDVVPGGRLSRGGALIVPNLFPYDDVSAIAVLGAEHFVPMDRVPASLVVDGLVAARDFMAGLAGRFAGQEAFGIVTWNYMPPSGGSQVHPHMQVVVTTSPGNGLRREFEAEKAYHARTARTYAADLLQAERDARVRWVGESGPVAWFAPFTPTGLLGDCTGVFRGRATLVDLSDADIQGFAAGFVRVLAGFAARGLWSFNLCLMPAPFGETEDRRWLTARLLPRFYLNQKLHVSDVAYLHLLLEERFSMTRPEEVAAGLREVFQARS